MNAKVLIVEDEMLVACEVEAVLGDLGHQVVGIAPDLDTAMELAAQPIDLALVDLNLRDGLTGPEIGMRLCELGNVAVLFVTANPRILGEGIAGAIGVLTKPTDEASVKAAVDYALRVKAGDRTVRPPQGLRLFRRAA
ncbi:response regulator [Sphingomonas sp. SUN039]|nr:response regulator [Sphingomonas sp. SUN039]